MVNEILKKGVVPDWLLKQIIHYLNKKRLISEDKGSLEENQKSKMKLIEELKQFPIALGVEKANEQHYELPYEYFDLILGKRKKYSCCYYLDKATTLDEAEEAMLNLYLERANIENGHTILDLGCGWGSFSLFAAEKLPRSNIVAVSNSKLQKEYIENKIKERNIKNLKVIKADINKFDIKLKFDRIISIEMFEHMRNYQLLLRKIYNFLKKNGKLFVHIFVHKEYSYYYEVKDETDWMAKYFFTNGIMPSRDLLLYFQDHLRIKKVWYVDGIHYSRTAYDWLKNHKKHKKEILKIFKYVYEDPDLWYERWKIFYLAVAEFFKIHQGREWFVSHYLFEKI